MISIKAQSCTRYPNQEQAARVARLVQRDEEEGSGLTYIAEQRGQAGGWFIVTYENGEEIGLL